MLEMRGIAELGAIRTHHVSTYIEMLRAATARQRSSSIWQPSAGCSTG
jgi:hypothetical protein